MASTFFFNHSSRCSLESCFERRDSWTQTWQRGQVIQILTCPIFVCKVLLFWFVIEFGSNDTRPSCNLWWYVRVASSTLHGSAASCSESTVQNWVPWNGGMLKEPYDLPVALCSPLWRVSTNHVERKGESRPECTLVSGKQAFEVDLVTSLLTCLEGKDLCTSKGKDFPFALAENRSHPFCSQPGQWFSCVYLRLSQWHWLGWLCDLAPFNQREAFHYLNAFFSGLSLLCDICCSWAFAGVSH